jgi:hypothetical protein
MPGVAKGLGFDKVEHGTFLVTLYQFCSISRHGVCHNIFVHNEMN